MANQPTVKRAIRPVQIKLTLTANRINENGTFSMFTVDAIEGPNSSIKASFPPMGGGSIYLRVESLEGIKLATEAAPKASSEKKKLF